MVESKDIYKIWHHICQPVTDESKQVDSQTPEEIFFLFKFIRIKRKIPKGRQKY